MQTGNCIYIYLQMYLGDEDAGNAFRIVSFRIGRSKQLLTFSLLKAVEEGWIQDVLQHLLKEEKWNLQL